MTDCNYKAYNNSPICRLSNVETTFWLRLGRAAVLPFVIDSRKSEAAFQPLVAQNSSNRECNTEANI